jgi:hypothetical protein
MSKTSTSAELEIREFAKKSIKKKRDAWQFLVVYVLVNSGLTLIWSMNGGGFFWPGWVLFGMGIGVVLAFVDAYAKSFRSQITDSDIDAEIERLKKSGRI